MTLPLKNVAVPQGSYVFLASVVLSCVLLVT
ncbi:MAG: hypothetical protein ACI97P_000599 [Arcticibacterium sp.]